MSIKVTATALAVAIGAGAACARAQDAQTAPTKVVTKTLVKSEAQKECFTLVNAQVLYYRFRSDVPLEFKLSQQEEKEIVHVMRKSVADGAGNYVSKKTSDYCLVWTNVGEQSATLHYEIQRASP
jgi:hypothetical protein